MPHTKGYEVIRPQLQNVPNPPASSVVNLSIVSPHKQNRVFCALDINDLDKAVALATNLAPYIGGVKIGMELFYAAGCDGVRRIAETGLPIFLDLKLHDIPNTVAGALRALKSLSPAIINIHIADGDAMMHAARQATNEYMPDTKLIGVTVLTSLAHDDSETLVLQRAAHAHKAGLDGVVCSAHEIAPLRATDLPDDFMLVVPGIRPQGADLQDQKRVMTPQDAVRAGADILVIGRPITQSPDPVTAAQNIKADIDAINC